MIAVCDLLFAYLFYPAAQVFGAEGSQEQEPGRYHNKVALAEEGQVVAEEEKVSDDEGSDKQQSDEKKGLLDLRFVICKLPFVMVRWFEVGQAGEDDDHIEDHQGQHNENQKSQQ